MQTEVSAARGSQAQERILLSTAGAQQVSLFIIVILLRGYHQILGR